MNIGIKKMKTRLLIIIGIVGISFFVMSIPNSDAMRVIFSSEQMIERSDIIAIGTIENTWVDVRPFSDYKIIDTAKISVDEWLKSERNSDTLDIRYYGYWAQTIENVFGVHRMDSPIHDYKTGQKVLIFATYEEPTMVMGQGYYPFYEGVYVIKDNIAVPQDGKPPIPLVQLRETINNNLKFKLDDITVNHYSESESTKLSTIESNIFAPDGHELGDDHQHASILVKIFGDKFDFTSLDKLCNDDGGKRIDLFSTLKYV